MGGCQENLFTKSGDKLDLEELANPVLTYRTGNTQMQPRNPNYQPPSPGLSETDPHSTEQRTGQRPTERCHLAGLPRTVRAGPVDSSGALSWHPGVSSDCDLLPPA